MVRLLLFYFAGNEMSRNFSRKVMMTASLPLVANLFGPLFGLLAQKDHELFHAYTFLDAPFAPFCYAPQRINAAHHALTPYAASHLFPCTVDGRCR